MQYVKKQTKGLLLFAFLGGIMVTSGVVIAIPGIEPSGPDSMTDQMMQDDIETQTEEQFCSSGPAQEGRYVKEYEIPSECTQPLAITTTPDGLVWFAQTGTGKVAKFTPSTERFVEYGNPFWPPDASSMMWGIAYDSDNSLWYTEDRFSSIWKFSIDDQTYARVALPENDPRPLPQRIALINGTVVINDFRGGGIMMIDADGGGGFKTVQPLLPEALAGGYDTDSQGNIWYTNWIYQGGGILATIPQYVINADSGTDFSGDTDSYTLPAEIQTPNGLTIDRDDNVWIADTSSSYFFKFEPDSGAFTRYVTSDPDPSTFGNSTGIIRAPVSQPYWTALDDQGRIIFNESAANRIAVFDPAAESLVEYSVPSKNPHWSDCTGIPDCGIAQVFGFTASGDKIWFTEWAENKIAVINTSEELPFQINADSAEIAASPGQSVQITVQAARASWYDGDIAASLASSDPAVSLAYDGASSIESPLTVTVTAGESATGTYKILAGAQNDEVTVSKYVTLTVS